MDTHIIIYFAGVKGLSESERLSRLFSSMYREDVRFMILGSLGLRGNFHEAGGENCEDSS